MEQSLLFVNLNSKMQSSTNSVEKPPATTKVGFTFTFPIKTKIDPVSPGCSLPFQDRLAELNTDEWYLHIVFGSCQKMKHHPLFQNPQHLAVGSGDYLHKSVVGQWDANQDHVLSEIVKIARKTDLLSDGEMVAFCNDLTSKLRRIRRITVSTLPSRRHFYEMRRYIVDGPVPLVKICDALRPIETVNWAELFQIFKDYAELVDVENEVFSTPPETHHDPDVEIVSEGDEEEDGEFPAGSESSGEWLSSGED
jgi:hypothetical protein